MNSKWTRSLLATTALVLVGSSAFAAEINFTPVPFATTDAQKRSVIASESVDIDGQKHPIGFNVLARSGDKFGDVVFAALIDKDGKPVKSADGSTHISVDADFTSLLPVGNKLFSITHFESRPGAMYLSELARADNGALTIEIDQADRFLRGRRAVGAMRRLGDAVGHASRLRGISAGRPRHRGGDQHGQDRRLHQADGPLRRARSGNGHDRRIQGSLQPVSPTAIRRKSP